MTRKRLEGLHRHVGFAWYTPAQWARLRELAADREEIDQSFEAWLANAERVEAEFTRRGVTIDRVPVDVEAAADWSAARDRPFDSAARSEYVAQVLRGRAAARPQEVRETSRRD